MRTRIFIGAVALTLVLAGCGKNNDSNASSTKTTRAANGIAAKLAVDSRSIDPFGKVLTDADGHTLYFFDKDATTKPNSACTGACVTNWPALTTSDGSGVGAGLDASLLGHNAANQYTYNGLPLYRFIGDQAAGDTHGQGVGGVWHIAGADGNPVMTSAAPTTTVAATTRTTVARSTAATAAPHPAVTAPPATSPPATSPPATSPPTTSYQYPY